MPQLWIVCGAGRGVGKTRLAQALCQALPDSVYAKQGTSPRRPDKAANYFQTDAALDEFLGRVQALEPGLTETGCPGQSWGAARSGPAGAGDSQAVKRVQVAHVVVESNALAKRRPDAIVLYLESPSPTDAGETADRRRRPDAERLRARAHVRLDGTMEPADWERALRSAGLHADVIHPVLRVLEAQAGWRDPGRVERRGKG